MKCRAFIAVGALCLAAEAGAQERNLRVTVLAKSAPTEVVVTDEQSVTMNFGPAGASLQEFVGRISLPSGAPFYSYTVLAGWPDGGREQLYLRVGKGSPQELTVRMHRNLLPANVQSIQLIDARGRDMISSLESYFDARHIFRTISSTNPKHIVAVKSCRLWFDASYRLASAPGSIIAVDPEAMRCATEHVLSAFNDPQLAPVVAAVYKPGYVDVMTQRASTIEWKYVGQVAPLTRTGQLTEAQELIQHYLQLYEQLNSRERANIREFHGVTHEWLIDNQSYIETLQIQKAANTTP